MNSIQILIAADFSAVSVYAVKPRVTAPAVPTIDGATGGAMSAAGARPNRRPRKIPL